jgi:hypothetical protein
MTKRVGERREPAAAKLGFEAAVFLDWDRPSATGREIYDVLLDTGRLRRRIAYTTVKTYLDRLVQKGYIHGRLLGDGRGTYRYTAAVSREAVCDHPNLLARLVRVFLLTPAEFIRWCHAHGQLPVFSANKGPVHVRERGRQTPPGALSPAGEGDRSGR